VKDKGRGGEGPGEKNTWRGRGKLAGSKTRTRASKVHSWGGGGRITPT